MGAQVNDSDLLREAMAVLAVFEERALDPRTQEFRITRATWMDITRNFRKRIDAERHLRLGPFTPPLRLSHPEYCGDCDGTGWVEGGRTIKTTCERCKGSGWEPSADT